MERTLLKILTCCSILLFFNCQNDDFIKETDAHAHENGIIINRISGQELKAKVPLVFKKVQSLNQTKNTDALARGVMIDEEYEVETDEVIEISKDGITHYTFSISRTVPTDLVENLVISVDADGILSGKIVTYDLTEEEKQAVALKNYVALTDKMNVKEVENINNVANQLMRTGLDCLTFITVGGPECPSPEHHNMATMLNGGCSLVNGGSFTPSMDTMVQIIADDGCLGDSGGGIVGNPTDPGTNPTNPGTGGGGGTTNPNPVITTPLLELRKNMIPCGQLKSFGDPAKMNLKPTIDALKDNVNNNQNNNKEYGFTVKKTYNDDDAVYTPSEIKEGVEGAVEMKYTSFTIGDFHTHTKKGDAMFSYRDVRELTDYITGTENSRKSEIFVGLVCKDKNGATNVYVLKINDATKLVNAMNAIWDNADYANLNEKERYDAIHEKQANKYRESKGKLEKSFLEQFSNSGISLFKATDDTMTKWSELELDNTTDSGVKPVPCI